MGRLADVAWSPSVGERVVDLYCKAYDVELADCAQTSGFGSFDAFFTRPLREGARPIQKGSSTVACPSDGRLESAGKIDESSTFVVKGRAYRVEELVGDAGDARRYVGGAGCVVYLSPRDYHRVHSPVDGVVRVVRSLPGDYFPVNDLGVRHVKNLLARNRRVAIAIDTPGLGRVTVVMVAAMVVGRITVSGIEARDVPFGEHLPDLAVEKGTEIGVFHLGSTVVLLLEGRAFDTFVMKEGPARMGDLLARVRGLG